MSNEEDKFYPSFQTEDERKSKTHSHSSNPLWSDEEEKKRMAESSPSIIGMTPPSTYFA
jgi:hypothetical protein